MSSTSCTRCTRTTKLERHHKQRRIDGGGDEESNLEDLCQPCHRYETTRFDIVTKLEDEVMSGQLNRISVLQARLAVLNRINSPARIKLRGSYRSYWPLTGRTRLPGRVQ